MNQANQLVNTLNAMIKDGANPGFLVIQALLTTAGAKVDLHPHNTKRVTMPDGTQVDFAFFDNLPMRFQALNAG